MIQEQVEQLFSKRNRDNLVLAELTSNDWYMVKLSQAEDLLLNYLNKEHSTEEKQLRVSMIRDNLNTSEKIYKLLNGIFVITCQVYANIPLVSVASMLSPKFNFMSTEDSILSFAEILSVLASLDLYDLYKAKNNQIAMRSRIKLDQELVTELNNLMYLPPMISPPRIIEKTRDHYHWSLEDESMILGGALNHHNGDISLDVLNTLSQQRLRIDMEFVEKYKPVKPQKTVQKDWDMYMAQTDYVHSLVENKDIYIPYKPDKRGRVYAQGHHVNSQGDDYHKAAVELANKQYVEIGEL